MATVIVRARTACEEARRLRLEAAALRFVARRRSGDARASLRTADSACVRAREAREARLPSAWSPLEWRACDTVGRAFR